MTALVIRRLKCNGPKCGAAVTASPAVTHLYGLRRMARDLGWVAVGEGNDRLDYCPAHAGLGLAPTTTPTGGTR